MVRRGSNDLLGYSVPMMFSIRFLHLIQSLGSVVTETVVANFGVVLLQEDTVFGGHGNMHWLIVNLTMGNTLLGAICVLPEIRLRMRVRENRKMSGSFHVRVRVRIGRTNDAENAVDGVKLNIFVGSEVADEGELLSLDVLDAQLVILRVNEPKQRLLNCSAILLLLPQSPLVSFEEGEDLSFFVVVFF